MKRTDAGGEESGVLVWDDLAGTFHGTGAEDIDFCADSAPSHPGHVPVYEPARFNAQSLVVLLECFGWMLPPELTEAANELGKRAGTDTDPPGTIY